ncbi:hypothetical protein ACHQM5_009659 [Ranunculus cassubicifolius]
MIKRRLYKQDHADNDGNSDSSSSSSSSDSDSETEPIEEQPQSETEQVEDDDDDVEQQQQAPEINQISPDSPGSGYESEDSSEREVEYDSSDDEETGNRGKKYSGDFTGRTLKFNSVYKCRLCPRLVCLTEESLRAHLNSKRHARSEKLLEEGRLKSMLNSDGEIEEDQETHAERHARTVSIAQDASNKKKKNKGRQRQKKRLKKKTVGDDDDSNETKAKEPAKKPNKNVGDAKPDIEKAKKAANNLMKNVGDAPKKVKEKKAGKKSSKKRQKIEK